MKRAQGPKNRKNPPHLSKFVHCRKYKTFSNVQEALHFDRTSNTCSNSPKEGKFAASEIRQFFSQIGSFFISYPDDKIRRVLHSDWLTKMARTQSYIAIFAQNFKTLFSKTTSDSCWGRRMAESQPNLPGEL